MKVVCRSCHREERWDPEPHVVIEGGRRRPKLHPTLTAWNTLKEAAETGLVAVGTCVCGQPLIGKGPAISWTLPTPDGPIIVGEPIMGPDGPMHPNEVTTHIEAHFRPGLLDDIEPVSTVFSLLMIAPMVAPMLLWVLTALSVLLFLWSFTQRPGFG